MALEERNGNYYYYKKEREGNRVVSKYYGKGELASLVAQLDKIEREEKRRNIEIERINRQEIEEFDSYLADLEIKTKSLVETFLSAKGFYKTKSREWRFKNDK